VIAQPLATGDIESIDGRHAALELSDVTNESRVIELAPASYLVHEALMERGPALQAGDLRQIAVTFNAPPNTSTQEMERLNPLGEAGEQRPGVQGAATGKKEEPRQKSDPTIAS
jgi:hypothetical protein